MKDIPLDPQQIRMPDFAQGEWLNVEQPLTKSALLGRAALVDFWDYTCLNCIRTLPYIMAWHERYAAHGLTVIGVHAPEFTFARTRKQITAALAEFNIQYPVLLDNEYETWTRFANRAWPTHYLIDADGYIRYRRQGEGFYQETDLAIRELIMQRDPRAVLPEPLPLLRVEDAAGAVCYRPTPELYAGFERGSLGNPKGYAAGSPVVYEMPPHHTWVEGLFYAEGIWRAESECLAFAGDDGGRLALPYRAVSVNAVLSPSDDPVELLLDLPPQANRRTGTRSMPPIIEVRQDGRYLRPDNAGADIEYDDGGLSYVRVDRPRMYELVRNPDFEPHEVEMICHANGLATYAFTFTTCVKPTD
jgi:thiol-disulfide isomerase/thioredoxin